MNDPKTPPAKLRDIIIALLASQLGLTAGLFFALTLADDNAFLITGAVVIFSALSSLAISAAFTDQNQ